jgi:hypothetical protein
MGVISQKLASRFRGVRKPLGPLRRELARDFAQGSKQGKRVEELVHSGHDPLHAAYTVAQNVTSSFAESVSVLPEFAPYYKVVGQAEKEYMPGGPPMSPLTGSYFTTWAFFDVRFGPDRETIGTCLLDVAELLGMNPFLTETVRRFQGSRMGIYEYRGSEGGQARLLELVTDHEVVAHVANGYHGKLGELWYVRLCPPLAELADYHVAVTTPYVLLGTTKADWTAYLKKNLPASAAAEPNKALHEFLKYGKKRNDWNEFVLQGYHHHQFDAIFLAGLPDVKESLPHPS